MLRLTGITKSYSGVPVLGPMDWDLRRGEVHVVTGENGSGKSTLMRIVAGFLRPDGGIMEHEGTDVRFRTPAEALRRGIGMIAQDTQIIPRLSVAENVCMNWFPTRGWSRRIDRKATRVVAARAMEQMGQDMDVDAMAIDLGTEEQQVVAIARAITRDARILIMDEPTAALSERGTDRLLGIVRALSSQGTTIVYVTHRLREVFLIGHRVSVLRDGRLIGVRDCKETDEDEVVRMMVGRPINELFPGKQNSLDRVVLRLEGLSARGVDRVDLQVRAGEILGLSGLLGSGRRELLHAVYGDNLPMNGRVAVDGKPVEIRRPSDAIKNGIVLVPADRKGLGVLSGRSLRENLLLGNVVLKGAWSWTSRARERGPALALIDKLDIRPREPERLVKHLSGGNQQKCVLGRWIDARPRIVLLDEPTQGVDIGARQQIYTYLQSIVDSGAAVVISSGDLPELLGMCHRIVVMSRGKVVADVPATDASEEMIIHYAAGG